MPKYISEHDQLYCANLYLSMIRVNVRFIWCEDKIRIQQFLQCNDDEKRTFSIIPRTSVACVFYQFVDGQEVATACFPWKWEKTTEQIAAITHECLHVVFAIARERQYLFPIDGNHGEEPFCYMLDSLVAHCIEFMDNQEEYKHNFTNEEPYEH